LNRHKHCGFYGVQSKKINGKEEKASILFKAGYARLERVTGTIMPTLQVGSQSIPIPSMIYRSLKKMLGK
jgi:hypothetical protein